MPEQCQNIVSAHVSGSVVRIVMSTYYMCRAFFQITFKTVGITKYKQIFFWSPCLSTVHRSKGANTWTPSNAARLTVKPPGAWFRRFLGAVTRLWRLEESSETHRNGQSERRGLPDALGPRVRGFSNSEETHEGRTRSDLTYGCCGRMSMFFQCWKSSASALLHTGWSLNPPPLRNVLPCTRILGQHTSAQKIRDVFIKPNLTQKRTT